MKKSLFLITFLLIGQSFVYAQNKLKLGESRYDGKLCSLLSRSKYFEASDYFDMHSDSISDAGYLIKEAMLNTCFNKPVLVIRNLNKLFDLHAAELDSITSNSMKYLLTDNYIAMQDFTQARKICREQFRISNDSSRLTVIQQCDFFEKALSSVVRNKPNEAVELDLHLRSSGLIFSANYNGHSLRTLFDTGSSTNYLTRDIADSIGIHNYSPYTVFINGSKSMGAREAIIDSITMGSIILRNVPVAVVNGITNKEDSLKPFDLVLGLSTMRMLKKIKWDLQHQKLIIPAESTLPAVQETPNMCRIGNFLCLKSKLNTTTFVPIFDSGLSLAYSIINKDYFQNHKELFPVKDSIVYQNTIFGVEGGESINYLKLQAVNLNIDKGRIESDAESLLENQHQDGLFVPDGVIGRSFYASTRSITLDFDNMHISIKEQSKCNNVLRKFLEGGHSVFEVKSYFNQNKDSLNEKMRLWAGAGLNHFFAKYAESNTDLDHLMTDYLPEFGPSVRSRFFAFSAQNYFYLQEYGKAIKTLEDMINHADASSPPDAISSLRRNIKVFQFYERNPKTVQCNYTHKDAIVKLEIDKKGFFINTKCNNHTISSFVNTSNSYSYLTKTFADRIGVHVYAPDTTVEHGIKSVRALLDSINMGSITLKNLPVKVVLNEQNAKNKNADFVLGLYALRMLGKVEFDFRHKKMIVPYQQGETQLDSLPNMMVSNDGTLYLKSELNGIPFVSLFDTSKPVSIAMDSSFYASNRNSFTLCYSQIYSDEMSGIMGVDTIHYQQLDDCNFALKSRQISIPSALLIRPKKPSENGVYNSIMGSGIAKTMKKLTLNFNTMRFECE